MNRYFGCRLALKVRDLSFVENWTPVPCPAVLSLKSRVPGRDGTPTGRISVSPFAPPALPGFRATMGLSDSRRAV